MEVSLNHTITLLLFNGLTLYDFALGANLSQYPALLFRVCAQNDLNWINTDSLPKAPYFDWSLSSAEMAFLETYSPDWLAGRIYKTGTVFPCPSTCPVKAIRFRDAPGD